MTTYKTFENLAKAVNRAISLLENEGTVHPGYYREWNKKVDNLFDQLNALWSNPADKEEAQKLSQRLALAWHHATN